MGPPSYMWSVLDRNFVMPRMTLHLFPLRIFEVFTLTFTHISCGSSVLHSPFPVRLGLLGTYKHNILFH